MPEMPAVKSLSIFLPAYNEEENISEVVEHCLAVVTPRTERCEVIVVVHEGSTDRTRSIVEGIARKDQRVRLVIQPHGEKGYGSAMRYGIQNCRFDWVFYTDSDNQYEVAELAKLLPLANQYDIVTGYRLNRQDSALRLFVAKIYNLYIRYQLGMAVRDVDCAFKLYRRSIFDNISISCKTGLSDAEILAKAARHGYRIIEVPVTHYPRTKGQAHFEVGGAGIFHMVRPQVISDILKEMRRLKLELKRKNNRVHP